MPYVIVVGDADQLRAGKGEPGLFKTEAAAHIGVCSGTLDRFVRDAVITPWVERVKGSAIFLIADLEKIRDERSKQY